MNYHQIIIEINRFIGILRDKIFCTAADKVSFDFHKGIVVNELNKLVDDIGAYDESTRAKAKNDFRTKLVEAFDATELPELGDNRKFGVDTKKVVLETILSVYEGAIALENRGSGMESLIKTGIALEKANGLDVILMEEPENHLSFTTLRRMLNEISAKQKDSQIIVATHNNMIASRLNLNNVLWITDGVVKSLSKVDKDVAEFFVKADDNAFLQLLLSNKVFLVEGATEFLLLPHFYKQITGKTIEDDGISVISCNGISYKNYLEIAKKTNKKICVITDNDGKQNRIAEATTFNKTNTLQHIFLGTTTDDWTWEACLYNLNKTALDGMIEVQAGADYLFHKKDYGQVLGKMLNNKVETAYKMLLSKMAFVVPQYIKDAIKWLREQSYTQEQKDLKAEVISLQQVIEEQERQAENLEQFIQRVKRNSELTELTPYALRELVKAVYVEAPDKSSGKRKQKIHISYDLIGFIPVDVLTKAEQA